MSRIGRPVSHKISTSHDGYRAIATDILIIPFLVASGQRRASKDDIHEAKEFLKSAKAKRLFDLLNINYETIIPII